MTQTFLHYPLHVYLLGIRFILTLFFRIYLPLSKHHEINHKMNKVYYIIWVVMLTYLCYMYYYISSKFNQKKEKVVNQNSNSYKQCSWSGDGTLYPHSDNIAFENTIRTLNKAGITYILLEGSLIGAYRHGGGIPCDEDMDIAFPVWLNGLAVCEDAKIPILQGYEKKNESLLTLCGKTRTEYVRQTAAWLKQRVPTIRSIEPRDFGGMRVDFAGVGVDWVVSILDQAYLHNGPICNCKFGSTEALCLEGTIEVIKQRYGADILTPDAEKMKCIKKMLKDKNFT